MNKLSLFLFSTISLLLFSCKKNGTTIEFEKQDWFAGGSQTAYVFGSNAYGQIFSGLTADQKRMHEIGDKAFEAIFVSAPAPINPGLGPIFNAVSCASCHVSDGRGKSPMEGEALLSLLIRVSLSGQDPHGGPAPVPGFGGQFQQRAIAGTMPEGDVSVSYSYQNFTYSDGETYQLRTPLFQVINTYSMFPINAMISPRIAPPVFGLGLLEAVPDASFLAHEDPNDADDDGISGKANYVWNILENRMTMGKFGWKAGAPNLIQQIAAAYNQDMGITSFVFPQESSFGQPQFSFLSNKPELSDSLLYATTFYMQTLKVPARRNVKDEAVIRGKQLFYDAKCTACHVPKFRTKVNVAFPAMSNQLIFPYTDFLLHDMGEGLADNRPDGLADGKEWKTPPLWGIGLTEIVNGHSNYLHDGRARNLAEAILWHGGEAQFSADFFRSLSSSDRNAMIKFLKSL